MEKEKKMGRKRIKDGQTEEIRRKSEMAKIWNKMG